MSHSLPSGSHIYYLIFRGRTYSMATYYRPGELRPKHIASQNFSLLFPSDLFFPAKHLPYPPFSYFTRPISFLTNTRLLYKTIILLRTCLISNFEDPFHIIVAQAIEVIKSSRKFIRQDIYFFTIDKTVNLIVGLIYQWFDI